jgi:hypothetical protein
MAYEAIVLPLNYRAPKKVPGVAGLRTTSTGAKKNPSHDLMAGVGRDCMDVVRN